MAGPTAVARTSGLISCLILCSASPACAASAAAVPASLDSRPLPGLRADVATLMMQGASGGGVDIAVLALRDRQSEGNRVDLTVEVAGESLLPPAEDSELAAIDVEIYAYLVDPSGSVVGHAARSVTIALDDWGERLASGGIRFFDRVEATGGQLSVRALVLVPALGRFGMSVSKLAGAADREPQVALLPALFDDPCPDWIAVTAASEAVGNRRAARPVWEAAQHVEFSLPMPDAPAGPPASLFGRFRSSDGRSWQVPLAVPGPGTSGTNANSSLTVPELDAGIYSFTVQLDDQGSLASPATEVWVVTAPETAADERSSCSWPSIRARAQEKQAELGRVRAAGAAGKSSLRQRVRNEYADVLESFGDGADLGTVVDRLVEWEATTVRDDPTKNMHVLKTVQVLAVQALAQVDRESLLPVFELHRAAYREHFKRRNFGLAGHSRALATTIAELRLAGVEDGKAPGWVADALVSLAATADRHRMFAASQGLLERAAEAAPDHRAARLLLSMLYEKLGEYEAAVEHLEALVAASPADGEGWLRLGTLQHRLGRAEECRRSLAQVIGQRPSPWVLSLAYQTLVQQLFAEQRFGEGLQALAEAEFLLPGDPALATARAYGLDRVGRAREALETLKNSGPASDGLISSRLRYVDAGDVAAARVHGRLRRNLVIRQSLLAGAVAAALGGPA